MPHENAAPQGNDAQTEVDPKRRTWERARSARPLPRRLYRVEDFRPLEAWITDISSGGMGLFVSEPLAEGALLFLELECVPEAEPVKVWAAVIRCTPADGGDWLIGCELMNHLSQRQLQALLV